MKILQVQCRYLLQARIQLLAKGEVVRIMEPQLVLPQLQISATTYIMLRKQASAASTNELSPPDSVRNLGVIFDSDFSSHKHVSNNMQFMLLHIHVLR